MKISYNIKKWLLIIGIIIMLFGIWFICDIISPNSGVVIDKDFYYREKTSCYRILVDSEKYPIPVWVTVTKGYFDRLEINDIYNKNENSQMITYWLEK